MTINPQHVGAEGGSLQYHAITVIATRQLGGAVSVSRIAALCMHRTEVQDHQHLHLCS